MNLRRKIFAGLISFLIFTNLPAVIYANGNDFDNTNYMEKNNCESGKTVINICNLDSVTYDEYGNIIEDISLFNWTINGSRIEPGQTKYYFPSGEAEGFEIYTDEVLEVNISWNHDTTLKIGLEGGFSGIVSGSSAKIYLYPYSSGFHRVYIKNLGNETITVNGTISF